MDLPDSSRSRPTEDLGLTLRGAIACSAAGLGLAWMVRLVAEHVPARIGEPLALRWLRTLGDHPIRGGLALGLLVLAFASLRRPGRSRAGDPPAS